MFEKKKATKNGDLMRKAPAAGAVELGDDVLEATAGGYTIGSWRSPTCCPSRCRVDGRRYETFVRSGTEYFPLRGADGTFYGVFSSRERAEAYAKEHGIE